MVSGAVADGDELPSRRVLSALLGLNPNTVQKACRMLEEEGLLVSHAGAKSCVRVTPELRERVRAELIRSDAVAAASAFRRMGVPLEEAIELVKKGYSMTIFPEGTRNKGAEGSLLEFKSGAFRVATKAKAPIVPLAITGSRDIMENHHMFMHPAHVTIRVLEPIETDGLTKEQVRALPRRTADIIAAHLPNHSGNR